MWRQTCTLVTVWFSALIIAQVHEKFCDTTYERGRVLSFNAVGHTILSLPGYFFCAGIGIMVAICLFMLLVTERQYPLQANVRILLISLVCLVITARLFGCLTGIYRSIGMGERITWDGIKNTGIVFYGGLFGLLGAYKICSKRVEQDAYVFDLLAVAIPLFHAVARIGCFVGGCCFGKESSSCIAILYTTMVFGHIETASRIPIQLVEAAFNILLFLYLFHLSRSKNWQSKNILMRYLLIYSTGRFILEFYRGDLARGVICGVSFSQVISVIIWICIAVTAYWKKKHNLLYEEV